MLKEFYDIKNKIKNSNNKFKLHTKIVVYCLKSRKNTESKNPRVVRAKNGRIMLLSKCAVCDSKRSKFINEQEASGLLSSLGTKTRLN